MCRPVRQTYGSTELVDDAGIADDDRAIRHCRTPVQIVDDHLTGGKKVSSQAFKAKPGEGCSVDLECLLLKAGLHATARCGVMPDTYAMIAVCAGSVREVGGLVAYTPKPADHQPANDFHGDLLNVSKRSKALMQKAETLLLQDQPFPAIDEPVHAFDLNA